MTTTYTIAWGHSGRQGREWSTAREASRYVAETWGEVKANTAEDAVRIAQSEDVDVGDWYADGDTIHVIPAEA